jgi:hypothetical protein
MREQTTVIGSRGVSASSETSSTVGASAKLVRRAPPGASLPNRFRTSRSSSAIRAHCSSSEARSAARSVRSASRRVALGADLHLLELAQVAQAHVEDRLGLHVGERELGHQHGLGLVLVADDLDDAVEVEIGDEQPAQHLEPRVDLAQPVPRAPLQHLAPVVEEGPQHLAQRRDLRHLAVDQHVHVEREPGLEVGEPEQRLHHRGRLDRARARLEHDAHVGGALVADIRKHGHLLRVDEIGDPLDQPALLHLVGDLGDDDLPLAAAEILDEPPRPEPEGAAPGAVGLLDRGARLDADPARGEVGPLDEVHQLLVGRVRMLHQMQAGPDELVEIVRGNVRRHADRDPDDPLASRFGKAAGSTTGSRSEPS